MGLNAKTPPQNHFNEITQFYRACLVQIGSGKVEADKKASCTASTREKTQNKYLTLPRRMEQTATDDTKRHKLRMTAAVTDISWNKLGNLKKKKKLRKKERRR